MGRGQVGLGNVGGLLVGIMGSTGGVLAFFTSGEFSKVTVVITLPTELLRTHQLKKLNAYIL